MLPHSSILLDGLHVHPLNTHGSYVPRMGGAGPDVFMFQRKYYTAVPVQPLPPAPRLSHCLAFSASIFFCGLIGCVVFKFALFLKDHHSVLGHPSNPLYMAMLTSSTVVKLEFRNSKYSLDG